ncbi:hypothetical protein DD563_05670 [Pelagicola sp. LXJ1103]|nr:hypothetical protein DD563_05670 [Pelagicola sp. LXJ1103]
MAALCGFALVVMTLAFGASAGARIEASAVAQSAAALGIVVEQTDICASGAIDPRHCPLCHATPETAYAGPGAPGMMLAPARAMALPRGRIAGVIVALPPARAPPKAA